MKLDKLKGALSAYLVIAQSVPEYDKRYDSFLASLLHPGFKLPLKI